MPKEEYASGFGDSADRSAGSCVAAHEAIANATPWRSLRPYAAVRIPCRTSFFCRYDTGRAAAMQRNSAGSPRASDLPWSLRRTFFWPGGRISVSFKDDDDHGQKRLEIIQGRAGGPRREPRVPEGPVRRASRAERRGKDHLRRDDRGHPETRRGGYPHPRQELGRR